ncbi:MAG: monovalent cation/H(+) antiporter subunit G [Microthrixaceae bacterium]|jgi:multicomponent Na+:H+ antiporter subunit G|nr:monovalent cation/H(+) antiporter subunit G [Microthrixaceae bacterium]
MTVAELLIGAGSVLILLAAVGVARFGDVLARMHALSKATTLGLVMVLIGGAFGLSGANNITFLVLGGALQIITAPVGSNLLARATYRAEGIPHQVDAIDELAEANLDHPSEGQSGRP